MWSFIIEILYYTLVDIRKKPNTTVTIVVSVVVIGYAVMNIISNSSVQ